MVTNKYLIYIMCIQKEERVVSVLKNTMLLDSLLGSSLLLINKFGLSRNYHGPI